MAVLVLVVDRDDDLGTKAGIESPVIGRDEVLKAGEALLLADPEDSDGNTIFAAVRAYDELISRGMDAEIALVAGDSKLGITADMKIKKALDEIFSRGNYEGVVFVSDGAEDDQVIPVVSSYAPIISKRTVVVKQAKELESTFYKLKTLLEDPSFARMLLGVPGILLLLWVLFPDNAIRLIIGILGIYMILRGFGIEEPLIHTLRSYLRIDPHSPVLPFHVASLAVLIAAFFFMYNTYMYMPDRAIAPYEALRIGGFLTMIGILLFLFGKSVEAYVWRVSYRIGDYIILGTTVFILYLIGDALLSFLEGRGSLFLALSIGVFSIIIYYGFAKLGSFIKKALLYSKAVEGATVFDRTGIKFGRVKRTLPEEHILVIERGRRAIKLPFSRFRIENGRLVVL